MSEKVRVFDRWGNYIGTFTKDSGCGPAGWIVVIVLIVPLVEIFYWVNVFRIGRRLLDKGEQKRATLWFSVPVARALIFVGALLALPFQSTYEQIMRSPANSPAQAVIGVLGCIWFLFLGFVIVGYFVQLYLCFKFSDLNF